MMDDRSGMPNNSLPDHEFSSTELRAVERNVLGKRWSLWAGVAAILLPLTILLALQYWWLTDLEHNSAIARKATLENYLDAIAKEVEYFYTTAAERALNLPAYVFTEGKVEKAGYLFKKKPISGAKHLFIVDFTEKKRTLIRFYNPHDHTMEEPEWSDDSLAVWAAASPWHWYRNKDVAVETASLAVDQHDPWNRIILNPITDDESKLVGLAGLIVDQQFFEDKLLPKAIAKALPELEERHGLIVCVRDGRGRQILPSEPFMDPHNDGVRRHFGFLFTDWTVSLQGKFTEPQKLARTNFVYNMTLSALLAAALIAGIVFTLRTALREMRLSAMKNEFVSNVSHSTAVTSRPRAAGSPSSSTTSWTSRASSQDARCTPSSRKISRRSSPAPSPPSASGSATAGSRFPTTGPRSRCRRSRSTPTPSTGRSPTCWTTPSSTPTAVRRSRSASRNGRGRF
jgi:hypothetical protein